MTTFFVVRGFESRPLRHLRGTSAPLLALALVALFLGTSCAAKRTLAITSDPSGAQVRLDDNIVGTTPLELAFEHYGQRRVTLFLEGYRGTSQRIDVEPPWYARFPIDFVSEVLLPFGWHDHHEHHVRLEKSGSEDNAPDLQSVLLRAEALRRAGPDGPRALPPVLSGEGAEPR